MNELVVDVARVMVIFVFAWPFSMWQMYKRLKSECPEKYKAMGKPTLGENVGLNTNHELMKLLFTREYTRLGNKKFSTWVISCWG